MFTAIRFALVFSFMPAVALAQEKKEKPTTVLIIIAQQDFFYREYAEPRLELEKAGIKVEVASVRKGACRPHANSGQGSEQGIVQAELAITEVDAARYDAILFSGGWGASMYQFAFPGQYANSTYGGEARSKAAVNKLIGDCLKNEKFVCGLCHGVSVLAWARVDGKSPLQGKNVSAPTIQGPAMRYNNMAQQPPSRWNAETNGAKVSPSISSGDRNAPPGGVMVDGKIITGENDQVSRELGRVLATQLKK